MLYHLSPNEFVTKELVEKLAFPYITAIDTHNVFQQLDISLCERKLFGKSQKYICLDVITIKSQYRRKGHCKDVLTALESQEKWPVLVNNVVNEDFLAYLLKRGYTEVFYTHTEHGRPVVFRACVKQ